MSTILDGQCASGLEVLWVAMHGFVFTFVLLTAGMDLLNVAAMTALVAGGGMYLVVLSEIGAHSMVYEWLPLVVTVVAVSLLSMGGARYAKGQVFAPPSTTSGTGPVLFLSVLGGYVLATFQTQALRASGLEDWIPLMAIGVVCALMAYGGVRYTRNEDFLPTSLTRGSGPRISLMALGLFVGTSFLRKLEGYKGTWGSWLALGGAAAGSALLASGGARYSLGGSFLPGTVASGPAPVAVMALLGALVYTAFVERLSLRASGQGAEQWWPLAGVVLGVGALSHAGARMGADSTLPTGLKQGWTSPLAMLGLALYSALALHAVEDAKGGLTMWLNVAGAASLAGGVALVGKRKLAPV